MARAYASRIIKAPVEAVWSVVRNFNGLPEWAIGIVDSKIEGGLDADVVGCVRSFHTNDGTHIRERLLMLAVLEDAIDCFQKFAHVQEPRGTVAEQRGEECDRKEHGRELRAAAHGTRRISSRPARAWFSMKR